MSMASQSTEINDRCNGTGGRVAACLRHVTKTFGVGSTEVRALDKVDFEVRTGELLLLVGPSGCGKTTLLSVLAGILDATEGEVEVFGTRVDKLDQAGKTTFRRGNVGFIFQQYNLLPTLTAAENVAIPLLIHGQPYESSLERARQYLDKVKLSDRADFLPTTLSGGQQQRVAIARALVTEPRLIVCDEPTAAIDGETGKMVMEMFRSTALSEDRAIVVVTHDNRVFPYGDRIAEMLDGHILNIHENEYAPQHDQRDHGAPHHEEGQRRASVAHDARENA
jgi:putative ABC transport system ATP-binding protein